MRMPLANLRIVEPELPGRLSVESIKSGLRDRLKVAREVGVGKVPRLWGVQELVDEARQHLASDRELQSLVTDVIRLGLAHA